MSSEYPKELLVPQAEQAQQLPKKLLPTDQFNRIVQGLNTMRFNAVLRTQSAEEQKLVLRFFDKVTNILYKLRG